MGEVKIVILIFFSCFGVFTFHNCLVILLKWVVLCYRKQLNFDPILAPLFSR